MKSKICFFIRSIDKPGGAERVSVLLANELACRGYEVVLLMLTGIDSYFEIDPRIRRVALNANTDRLLLLGYPYFLFKLAQFLVKERFEVFINVCVIMSLVSWIVPFVSSARLISWEHFNMEINPRPFVSKFSRRLAYQLSDKLIVLTKNDQLNYNKKFGFNSKVIVIENPITLVSVKAADLSLKNVISIGRLTSQKGYYYLLEAWAIVCQSVPEWTLTIVGQGELQLQLTEQAVRLDILNRVFFEMPQKNVATFYERASIYAMSSLFEGMPLVLLEAMYMGLPLVSFNCPYGPKELIEVGVNGFLVEFKNIQQLAERLLYLINRPEERIRIGENSKQLSKRFSPELITQKWTELVISLAP